MKRSPLNADADKVRAFQQRAQRKGVSPASTAQRERVKDRSCIECWTQPCDPAHLTPRSLGGCNDELCVVPLCRECHELFDHGLLDLEAVLALPQFALERGHMATHLSFELCRLRLRGMAA